MTIITTADKREFERIANDNKHLLQKREIIVVKGNFGQRKYKKMLNTLKLIL